MESTFIYCTFGLLLKLINTIRIEIFIVKIVVETFDHLLHRLMKNSMVEESLLEEEAFPRPPHRRLFLMGSFFYRKQAIILLSTPKRQFPKKYK